MEWDRVGRTAEPSELLIETGERGMYSEDYQRLTGEFYLGEKDLPAGAVRFSSK